MSRSRDRSAKRGRRPSGVRERFSGRFRLPAEGAASGRAARQHPLAGFYAPLFTTVHALHAGGDLGDASKFRTEIQKQLEEAEKKAREAGYSSRQLDEARFPIVALIDEAVGSSQWPGRAIWRNEPLQKLYFDTRLAGVEFYQRLAALRENPAENLPLLELYYACLGVGFAGLHRVQEPEKLDALIAELSQLISAGRAVDLEAIAPRWDRPDKYSEAAGEGVPVWLSALILVVAMILSVVAFSTLARIHEQDQTVEISCFGSTTDTS